MPKSDLFNYPNRFNFELLLGESLSRIGIETDIAENEGETVY